jgi:tetratricopeptide (TPR) repeat protein
MPNGKIVTFYSYKGGTGRTMALANVAWILASNGLKVLVVDWDLDSPGLHNYFRPFLDEEKIAATPGVIDMITAYAWAAATPAEDWPVDWHVEYAQILPHAISLNWTGFSGDGTLDFVSAGKQNRDYSSSVSSVDWDNFYDRLGGGRFFDALRADMLKQYDYVLIDSRTGLSDIADICTVHLPDILVDCFTLNNQSIEGAAAVARNVDRRYHYRNIRILPVPMRIEEAEREKLDMGRSLARTRFEHFPIGLNEDETDAYWASVEIPYRPYYAYEESLAVFGDAPGSPLSLLAAYERLTAAITENRIRKLPPMDESIRLRNRDKFARMQAPGEVFVSAAPEDQMWADWITATLQSARARVLRSTASASTGGNVREEARRLATSARRTVALISSAYFRSDHSRGVEDAIASADPASVEEWLTPVRVSEVSTRRTLFVDRATIDLTRRDENQATDELIRALGLIPMRVPQQGESAHLKPRYPRTIPPIWSVPSRNAAFFGRDDELERLRDQLLGTGQAVVLPVALYGLGGVGKTEVALEYAHRYMADYDIVWWIPAEQPELIGPAFAELAARLDIRAADSITDAASDAREALRRGKPYDRWLLIFDNADDPANLESFLPGGPGHVLVTSRNPEWTRIADPVEINVFSRLESLEVLKRRVRSLSEDDANLVADTLGDLPLAIEQAAAWLETTGMPAADYVSMLEHQYATTTLDLTAASDYPTPVALTWGVSFDRLRQQSPAAGRLLELCSFFGPEDISLTLVYSDEMVRALLPYDGRLRERMVMGQLIRDIARFSLAKVDRGSNAIQVHRLVQRVIRVQMASDDYRDDVMHEVHGVLVGGRPSQGDTDDPENWLKYDLIWPHLGPSDALDCDSEETRQLVIDRVRYLWLRGEYEGAVEFGQRLLDMWLAKFGSHDMQVLYLRFHLANVLRSQGRFTEALAMDSEVFQAQTEVLGDTHPHTLYTAGGRGGDLRGLGRFNDAHAMDQETYDRVSELLGEDHPSTLSAANNLAVDLRLIGDTYGARDLDRLTLRLRREVLGEDHPMTLHSAAMLARDLRDAGDYAGSADLLKATHKSFVDVLGEDSLDTLRTAKSLAVSLRKVGQLEGAHKLTIDTRDRYARNYATNHPDALGCRLNLACELSAMDDKVAAYDVAGTVLTAYQETLGKSHPFTLATENNMSTYLRAFQPEDGLALAERTLTAMRAALSADHPFTLSCAVNLANCLSDADRLPEAERLLRDAHDRLTDTLRRFHPDSLVCAANLAVTLYRQRQEDEAEQLQEQTLTAMRRVLGEVHPSVHALRMWQLQSRDLEVQPT